MNTETEALLAKIKRLRYASVGAWLLAVLLTTAFAVTANRITTWYWWIPVALGCGLLQFIITEIESALFTGKIPPVWSKKRTSRTIWIWIAAVIVLAFDMLLQLGGVGTFLQFVEDSTSGKVLSNDFNVPDEGIATVTRVMNVALAFISATGSELLNMFADHLESTLHKPTMTEHTETKHRPARGPQVPDKKPTAPERTTTEDAIAAVVANIRPDPNLTVPTRRR